jgi:hypothetical protein
MRCRKKKFSKINAKIVLADMQAKDKGAKRIYYHDVCKAWHITSKEYRETSSSSEDNTSIMGETEV